MSRLLLIALLCAPLCAQVKVGDDAPDFAPANWINPPTFDSLDELQGDVIFLKAWGINCTTSMKELTDVNKLAATPGLHVITFYAQAHKLEQIEEVVKANAIQYPIALDEKPWLAGYESPDLPRVWIVGTDGKVKFAGSEGYADVLKTELAKVKYPGLGLSEVSKKLEPAAKAFVEGKYKEAYDLADKVYYDTDDTTEEEHADHIMKRIDGLTTTLSLRAGTAESLRNYERAIRCWTELARFKGMDDAEEATARLKKLTDDPAVKKEREARRALTSLMLALDVEFQGVDDSEPAAVKAFREKCLAAYVDFAAANKGTGAADLAGDFAKSFRQLLGLPEPEESKPDETKPKD